MPIEIKGNWEKGFALDLHILSSTYLGQNQYGCDQFDTMRTEIGQLVYELKYKGNQSVLQKIIRMIQSSFRSFEKIDVIIPVPPSKRREYRLEPLITENIFVLFMLL